MPKEPRGRLKRGPTKRTSGDRTEIQAQRAKIQGEELVRKELERSAARTSAMEASINDSAHGASEAEAVDGQRANRKSDTANERAQGGRNDAETRGLNTLLHPLPGP